MATIPKPAGGFLTAFLRRIGDSFAEFGDLSAFGGEVLSMTFRRPARGAVTPIFYAVGVRSIPVVAVTGLFIGMVLGVQSYGQFHSLGMATRLGSIIDMSVVRELGPVLAATMLAGRVGGAMAAELATMRITEQIDAMACLGTNPVHRLAAPRFMACVLLIPLLTTVANFMGVMGGALVCTQVYNIDAHFYWQNAEGFVSLWDLTVGLIKPMFFGAAIAIIGCHRGFQAGSGAEGVGRAATRAFVASFIAILVLDFFLALFLNNLYGLIWPVGEGLAVTTEQPAPESPLIALHQVSMQFGGQRVLHAVDLEIRRGQTVAVIGESGCGKTVLLKLLIGLLRPTVGRVLFDGKVLPDLPERELTKQRRRIGFLFQGAALFDSLTVYDNVAFGLHAQNGKSEAEVREVVRQRLQEVGLTAAAMDKKPAELSGGMKKRVGLARALALDPEVMLYDEPTTGLDPIMTDVINELILQTRQRRPITSVVVTHEMKTVFKVADRVVMLYPLSRLTPGENQVLFDGTPDELRQATDPRVRQFVEGEARDRLQELAQTAE